MVERRSGPEHGRGRGVRIDCAERTLGHPVADDARDLPRQLGHVLLDHLPRVLGDGVVGGLNVDRSDVVREQHDLVRVDLASILAGQIRRLDQSRLEQTGDEGAGAGEPIQDVYVLIG